MVTYSGVIVMNYIAIYTDLVLKKGRKSIPDDDYYERHHLVPKTMGGTDDADNLVYLTAREHYIAHLLLMKAFPDQSGLAHAVLVMSGKRFFQDSKRFTVPSRLFEAARKASMGSNHSLSRRVHTPLGWFGSVREAARAMKISHPLISKRAASKKFFHKDYYYEGEENKACTEDSKRGKHRGRPIITPRGVFNSVREAAAEFGVYHSTVSKWARAGYKGFSYIENCAENPVKSKRRVHTPLGWFDSVKLAAEAENAAGPWVVSYRCKNRVKDYYYSEQD